MDEISIGKIAVGIYVILLVIAQVLIYRRVGTIDVSEFHTLSIVELSIICIFAALVLFNLSMHSAISHTDYIVIFLVFVSLITAIADYIVKKRNMINDPDQSNVDNDVIRYSGLISLCMLALGAAPYYYLEQWRSALASSFNEFSLHH